MLFRFSATPDFDFITYFARHLQTPIHNGVLEIPEKLGQGSIRKVAFGPDFKITLHHYLLQEELLLERTASGLGNELVTIFFYDNEQALGIAYNQEPPVLFSQRTESAIQVTSNDLSSTIRFPAQQRIQYVVVAITPTRLTELLALRDPNSVLQTITGRGNSFLFFESMPAEARLLLTKLMTVDLQASLSQFYLQIKVQELLYLVFQKLSLRENATHQPLNSADAARLLEVRQALLRDLSVPPVLRELAHVAAMSETKLKQLFKQTFGTPIYSYYQQARMEEAAFLLKHGRYSVAQVGYELGFSNLSHFSRLFEKHYGQNPKKFSVS
ncbi:AraC family transcriptional regulator [Hymenobacter crusticola]|uniref:AraC family transcriptional regulator n=2 Tax=Hymenobacter crusticola TaxID=1770526 RepID=A0A243WBI1_9BACT|nr:AraC family transcriptional regulator [Hymenobacter crusticola]